MKDFFTLPDLELSQESSVDPLGMQIIWTKYGQDIFGEKINTIANDLRVLSFNLFHHHLLQRLFHEHSEELAKAKKQYTNWQTEFDVKAGLLIFLEDLVTHVFYHSDKTDDTEILGVLGMTKARSVYNSTENKLIFLAADKRMGILKNQLNLGMTGRYKGSMMNMHFFDRSFSYTPNTWEQVDRFLKEWKELIQLENLLIEWILRVLFKSVGKEFPKINVEQLLNDSNWSSMSSGYLTCFRQRELPKALQDFWKDKLGLNSGAPKALFNAVTEAEGSQPILHREVFQKAKTDLADEPGEIKKLDTALKVEPILSHTSFIFRFLAQPQIQKLEDHYPMLENMRNVIISEANFDDVDITPRLKLLYQVLIKEGSISEWVKELFNYHKKVMIGRGGNVWVELTENNTLKHYFSPQLPDSMNTMEKYLEKRPWRHTYYLETLVSINKGFN